MAKPPRVPIDFAPRRRGPQKVPTEEICSGNLQKLLGRNLRVARLKCGMTLDDVARVTGMTHQNISAIERGEVNLTISTIKKLVTAVKLAPADILNPIETQSKMVGNADDPVIAATELNALSDLVRVVAAPGAKKKRMRGRDI